VVKNIDIKKCIGYIYFHTGMAPTAQGLHNEFNETMSPNIRGESKCQMRRKKH
jgi:hypothetical protein